ncbi:MAG: nitroreductase family protein [Thermodesulfobacteriota bacterium]
MAAKVRISNYRVNQYEVNRIFIDRWSPRAMSGEEIADGELFSLFEAARWAPSSFNNQPWRFVYAKRNSHYWDQFFGFLLEGNQAWADKAAALIVVISKTTFDYNGKPSKTHTFDTGAAWANLALQGSNKGLVIHGMQGFDYDKVKEELDIPDEYKVEMMVAVGKPGSKKDLPEKLQIGEVPSGRKTIKEIVREGEFGFL